MALSITGQTDQNGNWSWKVENKGKEFEFERKDIAVLLSTLLDDPEFQDIAITKLQTLGKCRFTHNI